MEGMGMGMGMGMEMEMEKGSSNSESRFKTLCVFSAECSGNRAIYIDAAIDLAQQLVERKIDLVYGGESVGLMAFLSHAVHRGGRRVLSVIPKILKPNEISVPMVGEVCLVVDMHKRKAEMARQADGFIALPGGYGTLEELFEIITWSQLGIHDKPVGLLNVDGYYNFLLELIDKAVDEGFINLNAKRIIVSAPNARELMQRLEEYKPIHQGAAP